MSGIDTVGDWSGAEFDPQNVRLLSILNDDNPADDGGDYCVRHDQRMQQVVPVIHHAGALYTTADGFTCSTCGICLSEAFTAAIGGVRPDDEDTPSTENVLRHHISRAFDCWDDGDAPGEWFQYVREEHRDAVDHDQRFVWLAATGEDAHDLMSSDGGDSR